MKKQSRKLLSQKDMKESPRKLSEFEKLVQVCRVATEFYYQQNSQKSSNNYHVNSVSDKVYGKSWGKKPVQEDKDENLIGSISCISREDLFTGSKANRLESSSARFSKSKIKKSMDDHDYLEGKKAVKWNDFNGYFLNYNSHRLVQENVFDGIRKRKRSRNYFDSCEEDQDFEYYEKNKKKKKQRNSSVVRHRVDDVSPMPVEFKNRIQEIRGTDIKLVIQKHLFSTDLADGQNRFSIPMKQIREEFLEDEEKSYLDQRYEDNHLVPMMVPLIEPNLEKTQIKFRKWAVNSSYVLSHPWNDITARNGLKAGMEMQLWSFRVDGELNLALVKVSRDNKQAHETNIASTSQIVEELRSQQAD